MVRYERQMALMQRDFNCRNNVKFEAKRKRKISSTSTYPVVEIKEADWYEDFSFIGGGEEWSFFAFSFGRLYFELPHLRLSSTSPQKRRVYRGHIFVEMVADDRIKKVEDVLSATAIVGFEAVGIKFEDVKRIVCTTCLLLSAGKI